MYRRKIFSSEKHKILFSTFPCQRAPFIPILPAGDHIGQHFTVPLSINIWNTIRSNSGTTEVRLWAVKLGTFFYTRRTINGTVFSFFSFLFRHATAGQSHETLVAVSFHIWRIEKEREREKNEGSTTTTTSDRPTDRPTLFRVVALITKAVKTPFALFVRSSRAREVNSSLGWKEESRWAEERKREIWFRSDSRAWIFFTRF